MTYHRTMVASQSSPVLASSSHHCRRCPTSQRRLSRLAPVSSGDVSPELSSRCTALAQQPYCSRFLTSSPRSLTASVLDRVATYQEPVYVVSDYNIRLDRPDDPHAIQLRQLIESYGLLLHDMCSTHQLGGTLDAVVTRADSGCPEQVDVFDVGLSDHHLLRWSVDSTHQAPPTTVAYCRAWR